MNVVKTDQFDCVQMIRLGYGPIGPPVMSVFMYVVDGLVIDTGQHHMQKYVIEQLKDKKLNRILLTHHHEDHSGNAAAIQKTYHIDVCGHSLTAKKLRDGFNILPYQHYIWGNASPVEVSALDSPITTDRFTFIPIHTPGHSKDHTVYFEENNGWLFSGDLYLAERIKYFRADEQLLDQINSLRKALELNFAVLFCAHNPCFKNGKTKLKNKLQFLEDLYGQVRLFLQEGLAEKAIIRKLDDRRGRLAKWLTLGNVSFANMIKSAIDSANRSDGISRHRMQ
jgi:glyoxylase-like metal-dependent hydrolase (beta-lactamase superfamily II)